MLNRSVVSVTACCDIILTGLIKGRMAIPVCNAIVHGKDYAPKSEYNQNQEVLNTSCSEYAEFFEVA